MEEYIPQIRSLDVGDIARLNIAKTHIEKGNISEAIKACQSVVEMHPTLPHAHLLLAWILAYVGRLDEAAEECKTTLKCKSDTPIAHLLLAYIHSREGRIEEAVKAYCSALKINPQLVAPYHGLAILYRNGIGVKRNWGQFSHHCIFSSLN